MNETLTRAGAQDFSIDFVPVSGPLARGIFATSFVWVDASIAPERIEEAFAAHYADETFVRQPRHRKPEVAAVSGSNFAEVGLVLGEVHDGRRLVTCFSAADNLIKGCAGQAVQNLNLLLGMPEEMSLIDPGSWP